MTQEKTVTLTPENEAPANAGAALPAHFDFITTYARYADVLEAPRMLHEGVAIQLVAAALNSGGVTIPNGPITLPLDIWMVLLSGSGKGRTTMVGMAAPILEAAHLSDLENSVRWGSGPALVEHFAEHPCGLGVWGEMAERLKLLNQPGFETTKEWMTDRYDNLRIPAPFRYRSPASGRRGTPPITFSRAPRINILATSSDAWFFSNLAETDSTGGFLPRWIPVRMGGRRRDVPIPKPLDPALVPLLAGRLRQIASLRDQADLSAILPLYVAWYTTTKTRFLSHPNPALAEAFFYRHRNHVLKLAAIFEASQSGTLKVSVRAWKRAVGFMVRVERCIFDLLRTGMSAQGYQLQRVEERIRQAGPQGLSQNEYTRAFQSARPKEREEWVKTLEEAGQIFRLTRTSGGRPRTVYVHEEFRQATP